MNENNNHHPEQNLPVEQAPSSLMSALLARLGLDRSEEVPAITPEELKTALASPDWLTRASALQRVRSISDRASFALLLSALNDRDDSVRAAAVRILGQYGDPTNLTVLERLETAVRDPAWHVRETAVYALAAIGSYASIFVLREALRDSEDEVRLAAIRAIRNLQSNARVERARQVSSAESSNRPSRLFHFAARLMPYATFVPERKIIMLKEQQESGEEKITAPDALKTSVQVRPASPRRPWLRLLEQGLAALLVLSIVCGWLILSHLPRSGTGSPVPFSEAGAHALGAPIATMHGDWSYINEWSPDGHTFVTLQIDRQKHELEARLVNATTGRSTVYPVLDSSWIAAVDVSNPFALLQGRYLVALRKQSTGQATMVIWDIIGQRAIATRTVPARVPANQVLSPFIFSSQDEQKFAIFSPDGVVTIWDVASGKKLVTCEGKFSLSQEAFPRGIWYDHDSTFLLANTFPTSVNNNRLVAWNTATGARLFSISDSHKVYSKPTVSPDNRYLLLPIGVQQASDKGHVITASLDTLEIVDAHSGQLLHRYHIGSATDFFWQPDSRHLLAISTLSENSQAGTSSERIASWDILTGQQQFISTVAHVSFQWFSPDGQYLVLSNPDGKVLQFWTVSTQHAVIVATPGMYASPYSYTAISDQYMLIGLKGNFDLWNLATGKLVYKYHGSTPFSENGVDSGNAFWSPDGKYLTMIAGTSASIDNGVLSIWRMP